MVVVEIFLIAVVVFGVAAVAMGFGGSMTRFAPDWPGRALPEERAVHPDDIEAAKFSVAFRGYRMSEVDLALERLSAEIAGRDELIQQLTGSSYTGPAAPEPPYSPPEPQYAPPLEPAGYDSAATQILPPVEAAPSQAVARDPLTDSEAG